MKLYDVVADGEDQFLDRLAALMEKKAKKQTGQKGGPGSGNFGHAGRPGEVGGSASSGGGEEREARVSINERGRQVIDLSKPPDLVTDKTNSELFSKSGLSRDVRIGNDTLKKSTIEKSTKEIQKTFTALKNSYSGLKGMPKLNSLELVDGMHNSSLCTSVDNMYSAGMYLDSAQVMAVMVRSFDYQSTPQLAGRIVDESTTGIFRHEYGHHVYRNLSLMSKVDYETKQKLGEVRRAWSTLKKSGRVTEISDYAYTNIHEFFAESFSAYTHSSYKGGLPKEAENMMKAVLGSKKKSVGIWSIITKSRDVSETEKEGTDVTGA